MQILRTFPRRGQYRKAPFESEIPTDTNRSAPLPFYTLGGGGSSVSSIYKIKQIMQTMVSKSGTQSGGLVIPGCSPVPNQFCVPVATVIVSPRPSATVRCAIS
jgi:hypothetical protein